MSFFPKRGQDSYGNSLSFSIGSIPPDESRVYAFIQELLFRVQIGVEWIDPASKHLKKIKTAAHEAVINSVNHAQTPVSLSLEIDDEELRIIVEDRGPEFSPPSYDELIRMSKASGSATRERGRGWYLMLTHSDRVLYEREDGKNRVTIIYDKGEWKTKSGFIPRPKRILIAEDDSVWQALLEYMLQKYDVDVLIVEDGMEARKVLESQRFDLLIMDLVMPRMNGVDLIGWCRKNEATRSMPVFVITARPDRRDFEMLMSYGVRQYFEKPLGPAFFSELEKALRIEK